MTAASKNKLSATKRLVLLSVLAAANFSCKVDGLGPKLLNQDEDKDCHVILDTETLGTADFKSNFADEPGCLEVNWTLEGTSGTDEGESSNFWGPIMQWDAEDFTVYLATEFPMLKKVYKIDTKKSFEDFQEKAAKDTEDFMSPKERAKLSFALASLDKTLFPDIRLTLRSPPDGLSDFSTIIGDIEEFYVKGTVEITSTAAKKGDSYGYKLDLKWISVDGKRTFWVKGTASAVRK